MFYKILTIAALAITCNTSADASIFGAIKNKIAPSHSSGAASGGGSTSMNPVDWTEIKNAIMKGDTTLICREGGICRKLGGTGCRLSKDWFSVCAVVCGNNNGFMGSTCARNASSSFGFNARNYTYGTGEHVADHLQRQLEKGPKGQSNQIQGAFFTAFCTAGNRFVLPQFKDNVSMGCSAFKAGGTMAVNNQYQQMQQPMAAPPPPPAKPMMNQGNRQQPAKPMMNQGNRQQSAIKQPQRQQQMMPHQNNNQQRKPMQQPQYGNDYMEESNQQGMAKQLRNAKQNLNPVNPRVYEGVYNSPSQYQRNDQNMYSPNQGSIQDGYLDDQYDSEDSYDQYDQGSQDSNYSDESYGDQYDSQDSGQDYGNQDNYDDYDQQASAN